MSDFALRALERAGDWERWSRAMLRAGLITDVGLNDHPLCMAQAKCGYDGCDLGFLVWSNCWYCTYHHREAAHVEQDGELVNVLFCGQLMENVRKCLYMAHDE